MTHAGTQVIKEYMYVMADGAMVVDWGDGQAQDVTTGEFMSFQETNIGHAITDRDLDALVARGRVVWYDSRFVYLAPLPEGKRKMME